MSTTLTTRRTRLGAALIMGAEADRLGLAFPWDAAAETLADDDGPRWARLADHWLDTITDEHRRRCARRAGTPGDAARLEVLRNTLEIAGLPLAPADTLNEPRAAARLQAAYLLGQAARAVFGENGRDALESAAFIRREALLAASDYLDRHTTARGAGYIARPLLEGRTDRLPWAQAAQGLAETLEGALHTRRADLLAQGLTADIADHVLAPHWAALRTARTAAIAAA